METFELPAYGLIVLVGILCGVLVVEVQLGSDVRFRRGTTLSLLACAAPAGFVGCKVAGWIDEPDEFRRDPVGFVVGAGHAASWGGLVLGGMVVRVILAVRRLAADAFFDAAVPGVLVAYAIGRVACHVTSDGCHGGPTSLPWGCAYGGNGALAVERVHPTSLYEAGFAVLLLTALFALARTAREGAQGMLFPVYLIAHWSFRFAIEFLRLNPRYGGLSGAQWTSLGLVGLGVVLLLARAKPERIEAACGHA